MFRRIFLISLLVGFTVLSPDSLQAQFPTMQNPLVEEPAPDFTLKTAKGERLSLAQYRSGQKAIIFFWATWCPHCRHQLSELNGMAEAIAQKGIKVILIDVGENPQKVNSYLVKNKVKFDVFLDEQSEVSETYAIIGVPTFFFVSQDGIIQSVTHSIPEDFEEILVSK